MFFETIFNRRCRPLSKSSNELHPCLYYAPTFRYKHHESVPRNENMTQLLIELTMTAENSHIKYFLQYDLISQIISIQLESSKNTSIWDRCSRQKQRTIHYTLDVKELLDKIKTLWSRVDKIKKLRNYRILRLFEKLSFWIQILKQFNFTVTEQSHIAMFITCISSCKTIRVFKPKKPIKFSNFDLMPHIISVNFIFIPTLIN